MAFDKGTAAAFAPLTRETIHTIQPSRATSFILNSNSVSISHAELNGSKKEELCEGATLESFSFFGSLPAGINANSSSVLVTESLLLCYLLLVKVCRVKLLNVMALAVEGELQNILLAPRLDSGGREKIAKRRIVHHGFFCIRINAQVRLDHVHVVVPMVSPVPGSVDGHGKILCALHQDVDKIFIANRDSDVEQVNKIEELARTEWAPI